MESTLIFAPIIETPQDRHALDLSTKAECYRFYVQERRAWCTSRERMNLWLRAPYCHECILSDPLRRSRLPDITPGNWLNDIQWTLGEETPAWVFAALEEDERFAFRCKHCHKDLRPWVDDPIYVVHYHLEEHYGIPLYTPGQQNPPERLRKQILELYGNVCFECGNPGPGLHIDP